MSGNISGGQQDISKLVNQYKEIVKTSGGNVDSLKDEEIASIFSQDLSDQKIDFQYVENGETKSLFDNLDMEKVPQDKIEELTREIVKLMGGSESGDESSQVSSNGKYDENDLYSMNNYAISLHGNNANKAEAREKYDAFQELKEQGYDAIKEKFADDERFQIFEKMSKHPDYKATSEEQRQAGVINRMASALLGDIVAADGPDKPREIHIDIPSIKPQLSDEEQELAEKIASGKIDGTGWGADPKHPFQKMDSLAINRVMNAATRMKIDKEEGKASSADKADKAEKSEKAAKPEKTERTEQPEKSEVTPTSSEDDGEKYGIKGFMDMDKKQQKAAMKARKKVLKAELKSARKDSSKTQREINELENEYNNIKLQYERLFPNHTKDWIRFGLNLVSGGLFGLIDVPNHVDNSVAAAKTILSATEIND